MGSRFDQLAEYVTRWAGSSRTAMWALVFVVAWTAGGFVWGFTDTYQLVINTATTIITFLMVFFIQHTQNRDNIATQIKLDELIRRLPGPRNEIAGADRLSEKDLEQLREN